MEYGVNSLNTREVLVNGDPSLNEKNRLDLILLAPEIILVESRMCKDLSVDNKNCSLDLINMNTVNNIVTPDSSQGDQLSVSRILIKHFIKLCPYFPLFSWVSHWW